MIELIVLPLPRFLIGLALGAIMLMILPPGLWIPSTPPAANAAGRGFAMRLFTPQVIKASPADAGGTVALGIYRPELPNQLAAVEGYEREAGRPISIIHWVAHWTPGSWKRDLDPADLEAVDRRGSIPMISWGPDGGSLREVVLSGANDQYIEAWATLLAKYRKPVLMRFAWEMNNQPLYDWALGVNGNTAEDFRAAWRYVRAKFLQAGATNVRWVWCPNNDPTPSRTFAALYPGDDQVDWLGIDAYNTGPTLDWGSPRWTALAELLRESYQALLQISSKPIILCEVGSTELGGDKAAWIATGLGSDLTRRFPMIKAVVWFDVNKEQPWQIDSSSASRQAFVSVIGQPHYASRLIP